MDERTTNPLLRDRLRSVHARVRRALALRHALRAAAAVALLVSAAVSAGLALPVAPGTAGARLMLVVAGGAVALTLALRAFLAERPRWHAWLESIEQRFPELRSWLRNALDLERDTATHTSSELALAVRAQAAERLAATPLDSVVPSLAARGAALTTTVALLALVAAGWVAPEGTLRSWRTLWSPAAAAPPVTLRVEPGDVTLVPGAALAVRARVTGTTAAPRLQGSARPSTPVLEGTSGGERRWRFDLPPVTRPFDYSVRVASLTSARHHVALTGEPRPLSFAATLTAPAYARLPVQAVSGTSGDLSALAGSRAALEVTFDRDLESLSARVGDGRARAWSAITPRRWRGEITLATDGEWELTARASTGSADFRYRLTTLPDAPPVIVVGLPTSDLDLPTGQQLPYDVLVQDDLGVASLGLEWRREADQPWRAVALAAFPETPREARATARWDASAIGLLPGESATFRFFALDDAPVPQRAVSAEFRLRFPTLSELYTALDQRQDEVSRSLDRAAEQTREVQRSLDRLQRQPKSPGAPQPSFERAEELRKAAQRQDEVGQQVAEAARQMQEGLEQAAERRAFEEQLQRKLAEMSELMKEIRSEEFLQALREMQEALQRMDRRAMEEALPRMQQENRDLLRQLERSRELLQQLRDEQRLEALAKRADELRQQQDDLNRDAAGVRTPEEREAMADRQQQAAARTQQLARDSRRASRENPQAAAQEALEQAASELEQQAAPQQESASESLSQGDSQGAQASGRKASESLGRSSQQMRAGSQSQQQERDQRNLAAVRRASQDLVSLSRSAQENLAARGPSGDAAERQTDLSEGVARVADSLAALSRETPFLSEQVGTALGRAMEGLSQSGREMTQGGRERGLQSGRGAAAALNEAVNGLREAESSMSCQSSSGSTGGKTASQRLGEIGERQSQLNRESRDVARRLSRQMQIAQGDEAEMRRLADQQRRIREQLAELRRDEERERQLLGRLDEAQREMERSEERLRAGDLGEGLEQDQTRILSRLLDAQRSVNRRDFDPQRESRAGEDVVRESPAALSRDLFRGSDRLRQDLLKADADRVPARYRALVEAYLRSLQGTPR